MKHHVNFITTLSPQKQYAMRRWFWVTCFLSMIAVGVSMFFMVPQLCTYMSLKNDVNVLREQTKYYIELSKQRDGLKIEHEKIHARSKKMNRYIDAPKNPHAYIVAIVQACGDAVILESINLHKKNCDITVMCPTSEYTTVFVKRLSASELFTGVKLVSLQQDNQTKQLRCVIKSKVIYIAN